MKLAAVRDRQGIVRVHAADCADVKREVKKFNDGPAYTGSFDSRTAFNQDWWGDIATDQYTEGTPEWKQECADNGSMGTLFLPCCSDLPEDVEPVEERPVAYRYSRTNAVHTHLCPAVKGMLTKAGAGRLMAGWIVYPLDEAKADLVSGHSKDCSRCARIRRSEQAANRTEKLPTAAAPVSVPAPVAPEYPTMAISPEEFAQGLLDEIHAEQEPQGYFSAAAKVAHTAQCPSMKAAASGKLHIPLMKTGFRALSALLKMIDAGEAKECMSCKKIRHQH